MLYQLPQPSSRPANSAKLAFASALLLSFVPLSQSVEPPYTNCDAGTYYPFTPSGSTIPALHDLLLSTHRNVLPYTSDKTDVWDALGDLDAFDKESKTQVHLIYADIGMDNTKCCGDVSGWNREHLWPKSYGVGYSGPDFVSSPLLLKPNNTPTTRHPLTTNPLPLLPSLSLAPDGPPSHATSRLGCKRRPRQQNVRRMHGSINRRWGVSRPRNSRSSTRH
jgi:hypothetical protein